MKKSEVFGLFFVLIAMVCFVAAAASLAGLPAGLITGGVGALIAAAVVTS